MTGASHQGNGVAGRLPATRTTPKSRGKRTGHRPSCRILRHARRLAGLVGCVGVGVLGLSVVHCTESISLLTGSHWALSALLAVGIDAGMVSSELAELAAHGTSAAPTVRPWARGYTVAAVLVSVVLNAYSFGLHAAPGMTWAAWLLGAFIPAAVYALGRVAGQLWAAGE